GGHRTGVAEVPARPFDELVVVEIEVARRLLALGCRVTMRATALKDRLHVAMIFHVLDGLGERKAGLVTIIPLSLRLVVRLGSQERRAPSEVEDPVVGKGGGRLLEGSRLLAMRVTAAAVVANLARTKLMPCLRHVEHHA